MAKDKQGTLEGEPVELGSTPSRTNITLVEDPMVALMNRFSAAISLQLRTTKSDIPLANLFAPESKTPIKRETLFHLYSHGDKERTPAGNGERAEPAISPGVYLMPARSGLGKSTFALSCAIDMAISKEHDLAPYKGTMASALLQDIPSTSAEKIDGIANKIIASKASFFKTIAWFNINEPATAPLNVEGLLTTLLNIREQIIIVDSINDSLEEYARAFKEGARSGGWIYSHVEFMSRLNAYAEAYKKVLLVTLNTDFFPLTSMLGRTEGEIYPDITQGKVTYSTRYYGRKQFDRFLRISTAIALKVLEITPKLGLRIGSIAGADVPTALPELKMSN
jgi:hypothetical protein